MKMRLLSFVGVVGLFIALSGQGLSRERQSQASGAWSLSGNGGTSAGANFLGTTDNQALELKVNRARALRLEPNAVSPNIIGGAAVNTATGGVAGATISGGGSSDGPNRVTDLFGVVGGGLNNRAGDNDGDPTNQRYATVGGGVRNTASGFTATIGGGNVNTASGKQSTVAGGEFNVASGLEATVGGGHGNIASGEDAVISGGRNNETGADSTTIGGGIDNRATANNATVAGGSINEANGNASTISGGRNNSASHDLSVIAGGVSNVASGKAAAVGGGAGNRAVADTATIAGGEGNEATGRYSTVSGGTGNSASGIAATIGGGESNRAKGMHSFVAGYGGLAWHDGAFVWSDNTTYNPADNSNIFVESTGPNQFVARASGGVIFYSNRELTSGVALPAGGGAWSALSDRNAKDNFSPVDQRALLERLASIPIQTWNYKSQDATIQHIGPSAQDFALAFGLGEDNRHISTVDADGVALAAIQGLYQIVQHKDAEIATLEHDNQALEARLVALEQRASSGGFEQSDSGGPAALAGLVTLSVGLTALLIALHRQDAARRS
jgi:hypothetical protein